MTIRIGILGYGNLGRGVECAWKKRRIWNWQRYSPAGILPGEDCLGPCACSECERHGRLEEQHRCADPLRRQCHGSACADSGNGRAVQCDRQLRYPCPDSGTFCGGGQGSQSFRTPGNHFRSWDPGLFSLARLYSNAILPDGKDYTFWARV